MIGQSLRMYATTYVLLLTIYLGEVHTFWEKQNPPVIQNWIWRKPTPMSIQWNVKQAVDQLNYILVFVAALLYRKNKVNRTTLKAFIFYCSVDTLMYFYNYKTFDYGYVYLGVGTIWILMYFWKSLTQWLPRKIQS